MGAVSQSVPNQEHLHETVGSLNQTSSMPGPERIQQSQSMVTHRKRRRKVFTYEDKSETSCDEVMMDDTPSNYNIANGRMEAKSLGLKTILSHAKMVSIGEPVAIRESISRPTGYGSRQTANQSATLPSRASVKKEPAFP